MKLEHMINPVDKQFSIAGEPFEECLEALRCMAETIVQAGSRTSPAAQ